MQPLSNDALTILMSSSLNLEHAGIYVTVWQPIFDRQFLQKIEKLLFLP